MKWLLKLYPPRWRRRYGEELAELVATQRFSFGVALDLMAGAIDAWFHSELATPASQPVKGDTTMVARMLHLRCAGYGPQVTPADTRKAAAEMIGGALALALLWMWAVWQFRNNAFVMALSPLPYFLPIIVSQRHTALKGRSARAQWTLIAGLGSALTAFFMLIGWISAQI